MIVTWCTVDVGVCNLNSNFLEGNSMNTIMKGDIGQDDTTTVFTAKVLSCFVVIGLEIKHH